MKVNCIKKNALSLIRLLISGFVSIIILNFICYFYAYTGVHLHSQDGATDYVWPSNQIKSDMNEGFAHFRADENGYTNIEYRDDIDILLMGSSHMESVHTPIEENVASYLNYYLPNKFTYNIGIGGHQIYHLANNLDDALEKFKPNEYVILETDRVFLDKTSMEMVVGDSFPHIPSYDDGFLYVLQKYMPSMKNIYKNIKDWSSMDSRNSITNTYSTIDSDYSITLHEFIGYISRIANAHGVHPIVFYHPETSIDNDGAFVVNEDTASQLFADTCEEFGVYYIDFGGQFEELYNEDHILAHGFINTSVGSGHLNSEGQRIIAEELSEYIRNNQTE